MIALAILLIYFAGGCAPAPDVPQFAEDALAANRLLRDD